MSRIRVKLSARTPLKVAVPIHTPRAEPVEQAAEAELASDELLDLRNRFDGLRGSKPLKIGIVRDLAAATGISTTKARRLLAVHCSQKSYLKRLTERGATRVDLFGDAVELVSKEDRANAIQRMKLREKAQSKPARRHK